MKFILITLLLASCQNTTIIMKDKLKTGEELVEAMYKRYEGKWYKNLSFKQKTSFYTNTSLDRVQIWDEKMQLPGRLLIKFGLVNDGNGMIFQSDSQYVYRAHKLVRQSKMTHPLLLWGFDIYLQSPQETVKKLNELNFDLSHIREGKLNKRACYILGKKEIDKDYKQIWIDKEHLYLLKMESYHAKRKLLSSTFFKNYKKYEEAYLAELVLFEQNNQLILKEEYYDVHFPASLNETLFDPRKF